MGIHPCIDIMKVVLLFALLAFIQLAQCADVADVFNVKDKRSIEQAPTPDEVLVCSRNPQGTWGGHPWDCIDQNFGDTCMFCAGYAHNVEVRQCLNRNGIACQTIFESDAARSYCNREFECPASTVAVPFFFLLAVLFALL